MSVQTYNKPEGSYDQAKILTDPKESEVKELFQSLNWGDPNFRPTMKFTRLEDGKIKNMLVVRRNQETEEGEIRAYWEPVEEGKKTAYTSPPIEDPQKALDLILLYHAENPELEKAIDWTTEG